MEEAARAWFKTGGRRREARLLWQKFRELSLAEFKRIYSILGVGSIPIRESYNNDILAWK